MNWEDTEVKAGRPGGPGGFICPRPSEGTQRLLNKCFPWRPGFGTNTCPPPVRFFQTALWEQMFLNGGKNGVPANLSSTPCPPRSVVLWQGGVHPHKFYPGERELQLASKGGS